MPFGPFQDFADCTSHMEGKYGADGAKKVCGSMQARMGEKSEQGHSFDDLPEGAKAIWASAYLESVEKNDDAGSAKIAWATVYRHWEKGPRGDWTPFKALSDIHFKSIIKADRVIFGAASVAIVDSENDLITENALKTAFNSYITRGEIMFYHKNIPVGRVVSSYTAPDGKTYKSQVQGGKLDIVVRINKDTQIANEVWKEIEDGNLRAFSIGGQVIGDPVQVCQNEDCSQKYNRIDRIDLHEISIVPNPANDASYFTVIKSKVEPVPDVKPVVVEEVEKKPYPWDQCVSEQRSRGADNPEAVCAAIKNRTVAHAKKFGLAKSDEDAESQVREWTKHPFSKYHLSKEMALEKLINDEWNKARNCPAFTEKALKILSGEEDTMPSLEVKSDPRIDALEKAVKEMRDRVETLVDAVYSLVIKIVPTEVKA